jgi:hypothetical protein
LREIPVSLPRNWGGVGESPEIAGKNQEIAEKNPGKNLTLLAGRSNRSIGSRNSEEKTILE